MKRCVLIAMGVIMSEPFLWGSKIGLPAGAQDSHVTALKNGTFLVIGKIGAGSNTELKAWIYNADGSLKEDKSLQVPDYVRFTENFLAKSAINPMATELPDGRIALTWSLASSMGFFMPWIGLYGSDLTPLSKPIPVDGIHPSGQYGIGAYKADDALSLSDGKLIVTYRSNAGEAFLRILGTDGVLSDALSLGTVPGSDYNNGFESVIDLKTLSNGKVVIAVRASGAEIHHYNLDPSGTPTLSDPRPIPISVWRNNDVEVTALEQGGHVLAWTEAGRGDDPREPDPKVMLQFYDKNGNAAPPVALYENGDRFAFTGTPDLVSLPGGGFAVAVTVMYTDLPPEVAGSEVRLVLFNEEGVRISDLLVSEPTTKGRSLLEGLSLLADGRIAVHLSSGIQIVDLRSEGVSLKGTTSNDHYIGTAFGDTLDGGAGADVLNGAGGIDFVSFASSGVGVTASLAGASGDGAGDIWTSIEGIIGSSHADILTGNAAAILKGRSGDDTYIIRPGDILEESVNEGRDTVIVGGSYALSVDAEIEVLKLSGVPSRRSGNLTGSDTANEITGHTGKNTLKGQGGNDMLKASSGNDVLYGGSGSDKLSGGTGNDKLYGGTGTGKDVFVFDAKPSKSSNVDRVYDFNPTYDSIQLENKIFTKLGKGSDKGVKFKADMFVKGDAAKDKEDRIIYDSKTSALSYDQDGTGAKAQVKIATLSKNLKLTYHDFFVI